MKGEQNVLMSFNHYPQFGGRSEGTKKVKIFFSFSRWKLSVRAFPLRRPRCRRTGGARSRPEAPHELTSVGTSFVVVASEGKKKNLVHGLIGGQRRFYWNKSVRC
jgi:hypothetical protein